MSREKKQLPGLRDHLGTLGPAPGSSNFMSYHHNGASQTLNQIKNTTTDNASPLMRIDYKNTANADPTKSLLETFKVGNVTIRVLEDTGYTSVFEIIIPPALGPHQSPSSFPRLGLLTQHDRFCESFLIMKGTAIFGRKDGKHTLHAASDCCRYVVCGQGCVWDFVGNGLGEEAVVLCMTNRPTYAGYLRMRAELIELNNLQF